VEEVRSMEQGVGILVSLRGPAELSLGGAVAISTLIFGIKN